MTSVGVARLGAVLLALVLLPVVSAAAQAGARAPALSPAELFNRDAAVAAAIEMLEQGKEPPGATRTAAEPPGAASPSSIAAAPPNHC